jgi:hypothetical protein
LNEAGWSLRRIGRDPRVGLSQEGVRQVLQRLDSGPDGWELNPLLLWRDARTGKDPRAVEVWNMYTARTHELERRWAVERHGQPLDELNPDVHKALRTEASDRVVVELHDELAAVSH